MSKGKRSPRRDKIGADGLTNKQRVFVEEYLTCWNASEAARRAGYRGKANVQGPRMLANVSIAALVEQRIREKAMGADEVLARLADHANGSLDDFITGRALDFDKARQAGKMHLLKSYTVTKEGYRIEIHDAQAALVQLGRHHGLFVDKVEVEEPITIKLDR